MGGPLGVVHKHPDYQFFWFEVLRGCNLSGSDRLWLLDTSNPETLIFLTISLLSSLNIKPCFVNTYRNHRKFWPCASDLQPQVMMLSIKAKMSNSHPLLLISPIFCCKHATPLMMPKSTRPNGIDSRKPWKLHAFFAFNRNSMISTL